MIGKRASVNAVINQIMKQANGIGTSKSISRTKSNIKGQNRQNISSKAHSIKSLQNLRTVTNQYIKFLKQNYGNKVVPYLNNKTVKEFLNYKSLEVTGSTLNTYISAISKMSDNLNNLGINTISREDITAHRKFLTSANIDLSKHHFNRSNRNPQSIVNYIIENSSLGLSAELSYKLGLRSDDSINSLKWKINKDNSLQIIQSKNGLNYNTEPLSTQLLIKVREAIENGYKANYTEYKEIMKEATEQTNQNYNGIHSLRYNYAQSTYQKLKEQGELSNNEIKAQISLYMGHSRIEVTSLYLA